MQFPSGKTVIGRITNTAINAAATDIAFKDINGNTHTFVTGERLIIQEIKVNNRATAKDVTIFQDADAGDDLDAAETLAVLSFGAAGLAELTFAEGLPSLKINAAASNTFMAIASAAGSVDIIVLGEVINS